MSRYERARSWPLGNTAARVQCPRAALAGVLALCFLGTAMAETGVKPDPEAVARGSALYETYCITCHRKNGVGQPRVPWSIRRPDLIEAMPLDETSHAWHHSDEQLVETILDGTERTRRRMPVFRGFLSEADAADLVAYLKSLWSDRIIACQGPAHMRCM